MCMCPGVSITHDKGSRAPKHFRPWYILTRLWILCVCQSSNEAKHPNGIFFMCGWLEIYGSLDSVDCDCLCRLPSSGGNMDPAAPARLCISRLPSFKCKQAVLPHGNHMPHLQLFLPSLCMPACGLTGQHKGELSNKVRAASWQSHA